MSLNKAMLIGHVTGDPELRYTPQGTAVCTFSVATNRSWTDNAGQRQESAEFNRCVSWAKLAEICAQLLRKGRQVYVDGRLQTREWEGKDGVKRRQTEIVVENMIALGPGGGVTTTALPVGKPKPETGDEASPPRRGEASPLRPQSEASSADIKEFEEDLVQAPPTPKKKKKQDEEVPADDIPF